MPLSTSQARRSTLQTHIRNNIWEPTPYISFTSSPEALESSANFRRTRPYRENQTVVVIDPVELDNHYICLWEVKAEEVVGRWSWDDLSLNPNWYEDIVLPAMRNFREKRQKYQVEEEVYGLSNALSALGLNDFLSESSSGHGNSDQVVPKKLDGSGPIRDNIRANL
ncbi:unnamed protein product [Fusarium venenatum]|uniref:Uncharacterized protein n=1 Tax=Fusarium venenatum TaxID=56646 RepID=A0A2L2SWC7_9HYPO|nr:uncharacterized protein FVRRES_05255 [Fusarium venenatum]CEI60819.1 unnamed protein product [Fusarium venenatum]